MTKQTHENHRKKRKRRHPFRWLAILLGIAMLKLVVDFPIQSESLRAKQAQIPDASRTYLEAQRRYNLLNSELEDSKSNPAAFVERIARRDYDYCWYGEVIYEVENLEEFLGDPAFDTMYGEAEPSVYSQAENDLNEQGDRIIRAD